MGLVRLMLRSKFGMHKEHQEQQWCASSHVAKQCNVRRKLHFGTAFTGMFWCKAVQSTGQYIFERLCVVCGVSRHHSNTWLRCLLGNMTAQHTYQYKCSLTGCQMLKVGEV